MAQGGKSQAYMYGYTGVDMPRCTRKVDNWWQQSQQKVEGFGSSSKQHTESLVTGPQTMKLEYALH